VTTIILSDTMRDAATYARAKGMKRGQWVWPARAVTIEGVTPTLVVTLPSYAARRDHHAIDAVIRRAVRRSRECKHVNVSKARFDAIREIASRVDGAADEGVILDA
jgi:hypothetical protein